MEKKGIMTLPKDNKGLTPLYKAVKFRQLSIFNYIYEKIMGDNNLYLARKEINEIFLFIVQKYLYTNDIVTSFSEKYQPDIFYTNKNGQNAVHLSCMNGIQENVKFFLTQKLPVNAIDKFGKTALYYACEFGHIRIVTFLIEEANADFNIADKEGKTPLKIARIKVYSEIANYLKKHGAK